MIRLPVLAFTMASVALTAPAIAAPTINVPADGKKHKIAYNGESYKVRITGNKISVYHIPTMMGRKRGAIIRDWNREVARAATGCDLRDEFVDPGSLTLEADLVCPE
ncbi:hypothetical protein [Sphingobium sp. WCS2017Hpa-17]|uniref:hypothetical protein n=1 Tax=Sphingobium sp. WCS2017Hpa-17 TaxID=3073638 RepID=UPI002889F9A8|nr:hypothetical protein [Sphingobium sp. WCS2017Hpa-17]